MATWKKIIVSGSNISQLNNDSGYVTQGTFIESNAFATASYNGTNILADSKSGALNFASGSGQGLTIAADAGTDTLTFGLSAIPNNSLANSSVTIAGNSISLGGSISQAQILAGSGVISGSTLSSPNQGEIVITNNGVAQSAVDLGLQTSDSPTFAGVAAGNVTVGISDDNTINTTSGNLTINSAGGLTTIDDNVIVSGDFTVNGTTTYLNVQDLYVEDRFILLASGSATAGDGGIIIDRGSDGDGNIAFGYDSATDRFGFQNAILDTDNVLDLAKTDGTAAFAGLVFTEGAHGATKPTTGEFAKEGAIYTATSGDIWIYS